MYKYSPCWGNYQARTWDPFPPLLPLCNAYKHYNYMQSVSIIVYIAYSPYAMHKNVLIICSLSAK